MSDSEVNIVVLDEEQDPDGSWKRMPSPIKEGDVLLEKATGDLLAIENSSNTMQPPWFPQQWYTWDLKKNKSGGVVPDKELRDPSKYENIGHLSREFFVYAHRTRSP